MSGEKIVRRLRLCAGGAAVLLLVVGVYFAWPPGWETMPVDAPGDLAGGGGGGGAGDIGVQATGSAPGAGGGGGQATGSPPSEGSANDVGSLGAAALEDGAEPASAALWQIVDEASVAELPAYKEVVEDRALVRVTGGADGWRVGQRIAVPVPQLGELYTPVVERIEAGPSGVRSYVGTLTEDAGRAFRFTITTGPGNTFAHLSTPHGTYELVATGELGWLMPTANMDQHVDYSVPDFVYPDEPVDLAR